MPDVPQDADARRKARELRKHLKDLTATVTHFLSIMDELMKGPSTVERGRHVAAACNLLDMANDAARHFGLGASLKALKKKEGRRA